MGGLREKGHLSKSYVKVFRSARDHWLWQSHPFDPWHAFEYLFMWAAWQAEERDFMKEVHKLNRGQHVTTERQLSRDWGWSRSKVSRYLKTLQKCAMIETKSSHGSIIVSICNYDRWQSNDGEASHERATERPQTVPEASQRRATEEPPASHERRSKELEERKEKEERDEEPTTIEILGTALKWNGTHTTTPSDEITRQLMQLAKDAKIPNKGETVRPWLEAWVARSSGARVHEILMDPWTRGKTVIEIQDRFFPKELPVKESVLQAALRKADEDDRKAGRTK